jgi:predicted RNase H-like nuclease
MSRMVWPELKKEAEQMTTLVAGADGCQPGWAVVLKDVAGVRPPELLVLDKIQKLLTDPRLPGFIAVDMPIGLPDQVGAGGRGPENELRAQLGDRRSSVFSIPARDAIYADSFAAACQVALHTSDPPRKVSIQAYNLFPKVRELDELLRADAGLSYIMRECHPEGAFMVMNGRKPLSEPKKVRSVVHPPGVAERKHLLMEVAGFSEAFLGQKPPKGVGVDDFLDACACAHVAEKMARGQAICMPEHPERDSYNIPIAIWA